MRVKFTQSYISPEGNRYRPGTYDDFPDEWPLPTNGAFILDNKGNATRPVREEEVAKGKALEERAAKEDTDRPAVKGPPLDDGTKELEQREPKSNVLTNKATGADPKASGPKDEKGNKIGQT